MAEPRKISKEITEPERRDLVRRIAERGSKGYEIKEETVKPSVDYSQAAAATFAADPVELPPEALADLNATTGQSAADAQRYAEAQRAIFAAGQQRELAMGNEFFDDAQIVTEATNFGLAQYAQELQEARSTSGSGGSGVLSTANPVAGLLEALHPDQQKRTLDAIDAYGPTWNQDVDDTLADAQARGMTYQEAVAFVRNAMRDSGIPARDVEDYLQAVEAAWIGQFAEPGEAPKFGPLRPGPEAGVTPDYQPGMGPTQGPGLRGPGDFRPLPEDTEPDRGYIPWDQDPRNPNRTGKKGSPPGGLVV
jgi:hypothetical protein